MRENTPSKNNRHIDYIKDTQYENCISLGWFCGVASSMSLYGLRSHSGPFDWYFSDLDSVLKVMENDFSDFMSKENLSVIPDDPLRFYDKKYGFVYIHDIQHNFEIEYKKIFQKYIHRIERFRQDIKLPTCFIRAVRSEQEVLYIQKHHDYIYDVIKKGNADNQLIFLLLNTMSELSDNFLWFRLNMENYVGKAYEMRTMFASSKEFSEYCKQNILSETIIKQNKEFDKNNLKTDVKIEMLMYHLDDFNIIPLFQKIYPDIEQGIYLFGAGTYGKLLFSYLIKNKIFVKGIIDNNKNNIEISGGIPIISFSQIIYDYQNICITVAANDNVREIEKQILAQHPHTKILKLHDIVDLLDTNC